MLTEWRVGYLSSHVEEPTAVGFEWRSCESLDSGYQRFHEYKAKYWEKDLINALMLVKHEFDCQAGVFNSTVIESMQKKLTPTVHYNKKENVAKASVKSKIMAQLNAASLPIPADVPEGATITWASTQVHPTDFFEQFYNSQIVAGAPSE